MDESQEPHLHPGSQKVKSSTSLVGPFNRFDFVLSYRPGSKNIKPDVLSRQFGSQEDEDRSEPIIPRYRVLAGIQWDLETAVRKAQIHQPDPGNGRLFVPNTIRSEVLEWGHAAPSSGHPGVLRTLRWIQSKFWWPNMGLMSGEWLLYVPHAPRIRNLEPSLKQVRWQNFSCNMSLEFMGFLRIVSERGSLFTSRFWKAFGRLIGSTISLSSEFHPQSSGQTERVNQEIEKTLRYLVSNNPSTWSSQNLPITLSSPHHWVCLHLNASLGPPSPLLCFLNRTFKHRSSCSPVSPEVLEGLAESSGSSVKAILGTTETGQSTSADRSITLSRAESVAFD
ncbi:uncharacterized protein LOC125243175 [Megalobrama amblycephala]|uniref:uncharacterized protein LOC125243175 n=1 Tax=Megalobrama amblycephala TaxID=75352 RepID=UPI00201416AD|nr:uncharacterized protein LOC125243175 [Megalobrama amblycephala]